MKKGNSDHYPEITIMSNDFVQCRYDIRQETKTMEDGRQHQSYSYSYIEMRPEDMNKEAIVQALLENGFSDSEIKITEIAKTILADENYLPKSQDGGSLGMKARGADENNKS